MSTNPRQQQKYDERIAANQILLAKVLNHLESASNAANQGYVRESVRELEFAWGLAFVVTAKDETNLRPSKKISQRFDNEIPKLEEIERMNPLQLQSRVPFEYFEERAQYFGEYANKLRVLAMCYLEILKSNIVLDEILNYEVSIAQALEKAGLLIAKDGHTQITQTSDMPGKEQPPLSKILVSYPR